MTNFIATKNVIPLYHVSFSIFKWKIKIWKYRFYKYIITRIIEETKSSQIFITYWGTEIDCKIIHHTSSKLSLWLKTSHLFGNIVEILYHSDSVFRRLIIYGNSRWSYKRNFGRNLAPRGLRLGLQYLNEQQIFHIF